MPNPDEGLWLHWTEVISRKGKVKVECNYCEKGRQLKNATKCRSHTTKCHKTPKEVRKLFASMIKTKKAKRRTDGHEEDLTIDEEAPESGFSAPEPCSSSTSSQSSQPKIDKFINKITKSRKDKLNQLFAYSMISGDIPFNWTENHYLKQFFNELGCGFNSPRRKMLSTKILEDCHNTAKSFIEEITKDSEFVTITIDGWENTRHLEVLNIMLCIPQSVFHKSIEVGGESVDNTLLVREIEKVIKDLKVHKVVGLITDNASPMILAHEVLTDKYPFLVAVRCSAHVMNLLIQDICKIQTLNTLVRQTRCIVKEIIGSKVKKGKYNEFWSKHIEEEKMNNNKVVQVSLLLSTETRWYSVKNMMNHLLRAKDVLQKMSLNKNANLDQTVCRLIKNEEFWDKLTLFSEFLKPIVEGMR